MRIFWSKLCIRKWIVRRLQKVFLILIYLDFQTQIPQWHQIWICTSKTSSNSSHKNYNNPAENLSIYPCMRLLIVRKLCRELTKMVYLDLQTQLHQFLLSCFFTSGFEPNFFTRGIEKYFEVNPLILARCAW